MLVAGPAYQIESSLCLDGGSKGETWQSIEYGGDQINRMPELAVVEETANGDYQ
jgi:hypothetical protein